MHDASFVPRRGVRVAEMPLQHQNLSKKFDIAARERQNAEARAEIFRPAVVLIEQSERNEKRAEKYCIAERLGVAFERTPVIIDGTQ
jgi:hypothetical protein